jgi:hypothetical protein
VLSRTQFDAAVRDALRAYNRVDELAANPLLRSRVVAGTGSEPTVEALRKTLVETIETLREDSRHGKLHRAVSTTFLHGVPTQQAAADKLALPFSTYRRHCPKEPNASATCCGNESWAHYPGRPAEPGGRPTPIPPDPTPSTRKSERVRT